MTRRSIILGLLGVAWLAGYSYFSANVVRQGALISNLMPTAAFGGLIVFLLLVNPLLRRYKLGPREIAAVFILFLFACGIPGWGMVEYLANMLMLPHHHVRVTPGWAEHGVVALAPPRMLADISQNQNQVLDGFVTGLGSGDRYIPLSGVPWGAWTRTLAFWTPLLGCLLMAMLGLAAVLHTQWAKHEQLPYPAVTFVKALLPGKKGESRGAVFRNRLFWIGSSATFLITLNNFLARYWPDLLIRIPLTLDFTPFDKLCPVMIAGGGRQLLYGRIQILLIGLAYFLPSDVSLSMTVFPYLYSILVGILAGWGFSFYGGQDWACTLNGFAFAGGHFGILLVVAYIGRQYYGNVLRASLTGKSRDKVESHAVLGMRLFLVCSGLFVTQLAIVGLDWQLGILYLILAFSVYIATARMVAETAVYHINTHVYPAAVLWMFLGEQALGPQTLLIMFLVSSVIISGPGWAPMPFLVQAMKIADSAEIRVTRALKWGAVAMILALAISIPVTIYLEYNAGAPPAGWPTAVTRFPFQRTVLISQRLESQGLLESASAVKGWSRFLHLSPHKPQVITFLVTMAATLVVAAGRLRFAWWPLHPVVFLFLGSYTAYPFSFFLGWLIKTGVSRYGGGDAYQRLKPLMFGVIAGPLFFQFLRMAGGSVYFFFIK